MTKIVLAGLGAGAAAALLFASTATGAAVSMLLLCLSPLPVMIVALGWSHWAGLIAALAGSAALAGISPTFGLSFLILAGIPGWGLGYLALLGRRADTAAPAAVNGSAAPPGGAAPGMEWYPPGRLLMWSAVFGAAAVALGLVLLEGDEAALRADLRTLAEAFIHPPDIPGLPPMPPEMSEIDPDLVVTVLVRGVLPLFAVLAGFVSLVDLWLAGHVVRVSERLLRPWPDLATTTLPPLAAVLLAASFFAAFLLSGLAGIAASLLATTLTTAFAVAGFAVLHFVTRGMRGRAWLLGGAYAAVSILGWPMLFMTLVGLADTLFGLRRHARRDPQPPDPSQPQV